MEYMTSGYTTPQRWIQGKMDELDKNQKVDENESLEFRQIFFNLSEMMHFIY